MKRLWFWMVSLFSILTFMSCSEEGGGVAPKAQLNFASPSYTLGMDSVSIVLEADEAPVSDVIIPVTYTGSAQIDEDFTASASSFVLKTGEKQAEIVLKRKGEADSTQVKTITMALGKAPAGYVLGLMSYTEVQLLSQTSVLYSFDKDEDILTMSGEYELNLEKAAGGRYSVTQDTEFQVSVDPSSTAEEGVHFEFPEGKVIKVAQGDYSGSLKVNFKKKEEGKDLLVLKLEPKAGYITGANRMISIKIQGAYDLSGTWAFSSVSNQEWWASSWGLDTTSFPKGSPEDRIEFKSVGMDYDMDIQLVSDLKNYFGTGVKRAVFEQERDEIMQEDGGLKPSVVKISVLKVPAVNVNFSAINESIREAVVGFRVFKNDNNEDILECTIYDYEPTEGSLADIYQMFKDFGDSPAMLSAPLRLQFKRAQ